MALQYACEAFTTPAEVVARGCACEMALPTDENLLLDLIDAASDVLARLTQLEVRGRCVATVRPLSDGVCGYSDHPTFHGVDCIPLRAPVGEIVEVRIDGVVLDPSEYGLMNGNYLFRQEGLWPRVNTVRGDASDFGVFQIVYTIGEVVNWLGVQAAIDLTCLFFSVVTGQSTALPAGTVSASLQGATLSLNTLADAVDRVSNEMPNVSMFLGVYGGDGRGTPGVWAPELDMGWDLVEVS